MRSLALVCLAIALTGCGSRSEPAPVASVYQGLSIYDYAPNSLSSDSYQVRAGETLYSIAFRANMDLRQIAQLNDLSEPYTIYPGQVLRLSSNVPSAVIAEQNRVNNRQSRNNSSNSSQSNDLTEAVASNHNGEYVETEALQKDSEKQVANADINWRWPSQGRITRRFSSNEPGSNGLIFAGQQGDPVTAAAAGKVVYVGSALRGFGRLIILKHNDDFITAYAHNDELLVAEQEEVTSGQRIATMGASEADSVRLRFELRFRGKSVNPEEYLPRSR